MGPSFVSGAGPTRLTVTIEPLTSPRRRARSFGLALSQRLSVANNERIRMSLAPQRLTRQEYLEFERGSNLRHEYHDGVVYAMSGAKRRHSVVATNVARVLGNQLLDRPCEIYQSDMRVKVSPTGLYTYPDVVTVCGEPRFEDDQDDTLLNPTIVVEVLSASTEAYDRGEKFAHYRRVSSVTDYVLISPDRMRVEHYRRQSDQHWVLSEHSHPDETVELSGIGASLTLHDIYHKVAFKPTLLRPGGSGDCV